MPPKKASKVIASESITKKRSNCSTSLEKDFQIHQKPRKVPKKENEPLEPQTSSNSNSQKNFYEKIEEIPTYFLSKTDMQGDPIALLGNLEQKYYQFGAVKLVASDTWNCPYSLRYVDKRITTRVQCLQKLKDGKPFEQKVSAYRVEQYTEKALEFERTYKFKTQPQGSTKQGCREEEYWNLVTKAEFQKKPVTVEYAADLSTSSIGSGFPKHKMTNGKDSDFKYEENYFNLNNISKAPQSLLSICEKRKEKISGISFPWLYMGMMFSTFCWHVEDSFVNSLNYNHRGSTKTWYIVPGADKQKFDRYVEEHFENTNKKAKNILDRIVLMIDPKSLVKHGIRVYKVNQNPREYVCTFFKAYHGGFSHGFNVGEAVNFISVRSLKLINEAQTFYLNIQSKKEVKPKALVLCKEWVLHENIMQKKYLRLPTQEQIQLRVQYEKMLMNEDLYLKDQLVAKGKVNCMRLKDVTIFSASYKYEKLSCEYCKNYIYLSAISCRECGILCQNHIERCQCLIEKAEPGQYEVISRYPNPERRVHFDKYPLLKEGILKFEQENPVQKEYFDEEK